MDSQYKVLSELLSDQAAFITSPKTSLANYWGGIAPLPPSVYGPGYHPCASPSTVILAKDLMVYGFCLVCYTTFSYVIVDFTSQYQTTVSKTIYQKM